MPMAFISGCSLMSTPGSDVETLYERNGTDIILIPASYREAYFTKPASGERHCRAPDPDFTVQSSEGVSLSDALASTASESVSLGGGQAAMSLGGRSPDLLITRELMYRACELASNINADEDTTIKIYTQFLKTIENISQSQTGNGTSSATDNISENSTDTNI